jgi:hypothetical protein
MSRTTAACAAGIALGCSWIVVRHHVGGAGAPAPADPDPHARVGLDVAHVGGLAAVLGDGPAGVAVDGRSDGRASRLAGLASRRLEDRDPGHRQPGVRGGLDEGVNSRVLRRVETRRWSTREGYGLWVAPVRSGRVRARFCRARRSSDGAHVGGVRALGALLLLVLDLRALLERLVAAAGDRTVVDEQILPPLSGVMKP